MRFIILGAGSIGLRHARNLASAGHTVMIHDPDSSRKGSVSALPIPVPFIETQPEALAASCDAVLICSPTAVHASQLKAALLAGRNVFVEKPLSHTLAGTDELARLAEEKKSIVLVGCNMRFFPSLALLKQLMQSGELSRPISGRLYGGYYLPNWRKNVDYRKGYGAHKALGGGVVLDFIHEIDLMRWLFGEAVEVMAMGGKRSDLEIDTEDVSDALIRFDTGFQANLHLDYLQPTYRRGIEIYGENWTLVWDYIDQSIKLYTAEVNRYKVFQEDYNLDRNYMYLLQQEHFVECLKGNAKPAQDIRAGIANLKLCDAIKLSAEEKRLVQLSEIKNA